MSQSTTISPSPISRKPVVLSRNEPFSMPVIQCLGFFLGMTASSLSVSILIARSSSVTRAHGGSPGGWAGTTPALARAMSNPATDDPAKKALATRIPCPRMLTRRQQAPALRLVHDLIARPQFRGHPLSKPPARFVEPVPEGGVALGRAKQPEHAVVPPLPAGNVPAERQR